MESLTIKHYMKEHSARFDQITQRGADAGLKNVSKELKEAMLEAAISICTYAKTAQLTDMLYPHGGPDHVPEEIEEKITKVLNDLDDQMTLEISSLPDTKG